MSRKKTVSSTTGELDFISFGKFDEKDCNEEGEYPAESRLAGCVEGETSKIANICRASGANFSMGFIPFLFTPLPPPLIQIGSGIYYGSDIILFFANWINITAMVSSVSLIIRSWIFMHLKNSA